MVEFKFFIIHMYIIGLQGLVLPYKESWVPLHMVPVISYVTRSKTFISGFIFTLVK